MCVCKCLNQRVRRIGEKNGKPFKNLKKKTKKTKKHMERLSFITESNNEFLLRLPVVEDCLKEYLNNQGFCRDVCESCN